MAWTDDSGVRAVRLDRRRRPLDREPLVLAMRSPERADLAVAAVGSDGDSFTVVWSETVQEGFPVNGAAGRYHFTVVAASGSMETTASGSGRMLAAIPSGERLIAVVQDPAFGGPTAVRAFDGHGNLVDSARLAVPQTYPPPQLLEMAGRVWMVDQDRSGFHLTALTSGAGRLEPGPRAALPVPFTTAATLLGARAVGDRLYVVINTELWGTTAAVELDPVTLAQRRTIPFGFRYGVGVGEAHGRLLVGFAAPRARPTGPPAPAIAVRAVDAAGEVTSIEIPDVAGQPVFVRDGPGGVSMFWSDEGVAGAPVRFRTARDGAFTLVAGDPVLVSRVEAQQTDVDGAAVDTEVVAVWEQPGIAGGEIHAVPLESDGSPAGVPRFVMRGRRPRIASNGVVALVVARGYDRPVAIRVDSAGRPLDAGPLTLPFSGGEFDFTVIWDGVAFAVAYPSVRGIAACRIGAGGELLDSRILPTPVSPRTCALAASPRGYLVAWPGLRVPASDRFGWAIHAAGFTRTFEPVAGELLVGVLRPGEGGNPKPIASWRDDHFEVVWSTDTTTNVVRVSEDYEQTDLAFGAAIGPPSIEADRLFFLGGANFVHLPEGMTEVASGESRRTFALPSDVDKVQAFVTAADGRVLMLSTRRETVSGYAVSRAWVRAVSP